MALVFALRDPVTRVAWEGRLTAAQTAALARESDAFASMLVDDKGGADGNHTLTLRNETSDAGAYSGWLTPSAWRDVLALCNTGALPRMPDAWDVAMAEAARIDLLLLLEFADEFAVTRLFARVLDICARALVRVGWAWFAVRLGARGEKRRATDAASPDAERPPKQQRTDALCARCSAPATGACARCERAYFCSSACLRASAHQACVGVYIDGSAYTGETHNLLRAALVYKAAAPAALAPSAALQILAAAGAIIWCGLDDRQLMEWLVELQDSPAQRAGRTYTHTTDETRAVMDALCPGYPVRALSASKAPEIVREDKVGFLDDTISELAMGNYRGSADSALLLRSARHFVFGQWNMRLLRGAANFRNDDAALTALLLEDAFRASQAGERFVQEYDLVTDDYSDGEYTSFVFEDCGPRSLQLLLAWRDANGRGFLATEKTALVSALKHGTGDSVRAAFAWRGTEGTGLDARGANSGGSLESTLLGAAVHPRRKHATDTSALEALLAWRHADGGQFDPRRARVTSHELGQGVLRVLAAWKPESGAPLVLTGLFPSLDALALHGDNLRVAGAWRGPRQEDWFDLGDILPSLVHNDSATPSDVAFVLAWRGPGGESVHRASVLQATLKAAARGQRIRELPPGGGDDGEYQVPVRLDEAFGLVTDPGVARAAQCAATVALFLLWRGAGEDDWLDLRSPDDYAHLGPHLPSILGSNGHPTIVAACLAWRDPSGAGITTETALQILRGVVTTPHADSAAILLAWSTEVGAAAAADPSPWLRATLPASDARNRPRPACFRALLEWRGERGAFIDPRRGDAAPSLLLRALQEASPAHVQALLAWRAPDGGRYSVLAAPPDLAWLPRPERAKTDTDEARANRRECLRLLLEWEGEQQPSGPSLRYDPRPHCSAAFLVRVAESDVLALDALLAWRGPAHAFVDARVLNRASVLRLARHSDALRNTLRRWHGPNRVHLDKALFVPMTRDEIFEAEKARKTKK